MAEPLLPVLTAEEVEAVQFRLSYHSPVTGGGIMSYGEAGTLGLAEAIRLNNRLFEHQEEDRRFLIRIHGWKV